MKTLPKPIEKKRPKNRKTKVTIEFDEDARVKFLTGFRKRKTERRKKAKEQMEKDLKAELKSSRAKAKESLKGSSDRIVPEVEKLLPELVTRTETHVVSVTPVSLSKSQEDAISSAPILNPQEKKSINKTCLKNLAKTKAFKTKKQHVQQKMKKKSRFDKKTKLTKRQKHHNPSKK